MRVLATCTGGVGHLGPLMPFVRGCVANGVDVLLAAPEPMRQADVPFAALPDTPPERLGRVFGSLPGLPRDEANARVMREVFGGANVDATLAAHEALITDWRPDVVLRETAEVGSYVAATRAGVPVVQVAVGLRTTDDFHARVAVGHGGFGTTFGALAAGVPVAVRPLFSYDQYVNAEAVAAAGAGRAVAEASHLRAGRGAAAGRRRAAHGRPVHRRGDGRPAARLSEWLRR